MLELDAREKNRLGQSALVSAGIWLIIIIILALIPLSREISEDRTYSEVRITLNQEKPEPVTTSAAEPVQSPSVSRTEDTAPSVQPARTSSAPRTAASSSSPLSDTSSSGLGIPDFQSLSGTSSSAPSGEYLDFSSDRPRDQQIREPAPVLREFEGSAARVDQPVSRPGTSSVEGGSRVSAPSDETLQALDQIRAGTSGDIVVPGQTASPSAAPASSSVRQSPGTVGPIAFEGSTRRLVYPDSPVIVLPPHLARLIDSDRSVTVLFVVRADGSVPASLVRFNPSALLPPEVQNYLKNEFSSWRFERGSDDGQARFLYSIKVQ